MHMAKLSGPTSNWQLAEVQLELAVDREALTRNWGGGEQGCKKGYKIELRLFMLPDIFHPPSVKRKAKRLIMETGYFITFVHA